MSKCKYSYLLPSSLSFVNKNFTSKNCRTYDICEEKQFLKEIAENYFPVPETIEKVSCNSECLYGTTTTTMSTTSAVLSLVDFSSKNQSKRKRVFPNEKNDHFVLLGFFLKILRLAHTKRHQTHKAFIIV